METNKNQSPAGSAQEKKDETLKKITEGLLEKAKNAQTAPQELKGVDPPKTYTSGELWTYGGIGSLLAGILGYFLGQAQGEKKAKKECERQMDTYREKMQKLLEKSQRENTSKEVKVREVPKFRLE